jgi:hypothetical protein
MDSDSLVDRVCALFVPFLLYRAAARALYGTLLCECFAMHSELGCPPSQPGAHGVRNACALPHLRRGHDAMKPVDVVRRRGR